jgi:hypothetical protein
MIVETTPLDERFSFAIDTDYRESLEDIFIKKEFLDLHSSHFGHYSKYQLVDKNRKESYGACHVTSKDGWHFRSPGRGAFGGALFHPAISFTLKERFYEAILENLRSRSAEKVEVVLPPEIYDLAHHAESVNILLRMGFAIKYSELNYAFLLRHYNGTPEFDSGNR